jgi:hypothetical protein
MIAIHQKDFANIRRFKNSHNNQFFLTDNSEKKYYYSEIIPELEPITIGNIINNIHQGFNTVIIAQFSSKIMQITDTISDWF